MTYKKKKKLINLKCFSKHNNGYCYLYIAREKEKKRNTLHGSYFYGHPMFLE